MRRIVWIVLLVVLLTAAYFWVALYVPYQDFAAEGVFVDVPRGASTRTIARLLAGNGIVRSRIAFEALCRLRPKRTLQAGEYLFDHPATVFEVFQKLAEGRIYVISITVPEGSTKFAIADLVEQEKLSSREEFLQAVSDPSAIRDLAPEARSLEGFLFPAKYEFSRKATPQAITGAMVQRFREVWTMLPEVQRRRSDVSLHGLVTIASLVERETSVPHERSVVAGVFYNRLRLGLPLQCDPTVIYALELAGQYSGTLNAPDLDFNSPYNTYLRRGLPPGPIANPGEASLRAALEPAPVEYLYFVADTHGGHVFSKTLREHNRNVAQYRRLLAENAQKQNESGPILPPAQNPRLKVP